MYKNNEDTLEQKRVITMRKGNHHHRVTKMPYK